MPKIATLWALVWGVLGLLNGGSARADWQADLRVITPANELKGVARVKAGHLRLDVAAATSYVVDFAAKRSFVLSHAAKTVTLADLARSRLRLRLPACAGGTPEACLKSDGYRKVGAETVNGYACTVYEKQAQGLGASGARLKIWRATQFAELVVARTASLDESGSVLSQADFSNVSIATQDDALFVAPADYRVTTTGH